MGEFFGTDGIRGVAGNYPLDIKTVERIGYSLARHLSERLGHRVRIIIGRDTRESGEWIEEAIIRGIGTTESVSQSAGIITTPGVAYLTRTLDADAGVVISASHNPYQDNGIKVFASSGQKLDDATENSIEIDLKADSSSFPKISNTEVQGDETLKEKYLAFLSQEIGERLRLDGMRIVIDCANGASYQLAPRLFANLGAEVITINADPNGRNINLDCGSLHPEKLQKRVVETRADLGIAFDGDADRLLLISQTGHLVDGDQILFIMADYLLSKEKLAGNRVVATVMSNLGLELALAKRGIKLTRTAVGDKNVLDELLKGGGSLGGEQSGHIIFPEISLAGDGMISALEVLRAMVERQQSLESLLTGFELYPQITLNVAVSHKPMLETIPSIKEAIDSLERQMNGSGRILVRYSGTENKIRIMIEGEDPHAIRQQAESLAQVVRQEIG